MIRKHKKKDQFKRSTKSNEKRLAIKMLICLIYLIVITILFVCSYKIFQKEQEIAPWDKVESTKEYSCIEISKMSEKFAYYEEENIGIHFVIEKEETGQWHTYLIAINENTYDKYKKIIDYTYERTTEVPQPIKVYGYPVIINDELKQMAIKNIVNFVPAENEITITEENFQNYLTNSYLDTTQKKKDGFNIILFMTLILLFIMISLLIFTIFDRDKIVDDIDERVEKIKRKVRKSSKEEDNC